MTRLQVAGVRWFVHIIAIALAVDAWLVINASFDAGEILLELTGSIAIKFLLASLLASQLAFYWVRRKSIMLVTRRLLGLWAVMYLCVHALAWYLHDSEGWRMIPREIVDSDLLTLGASGLLLLSALALTSFPRFRRPPMTLVRWKRLHSLVYIVLPIALLHYYIQIRFDYTDFLVYLAIYVLCLSLKLWRYAPRNAGLR